MIEPLVHFTEMQPAGYGQSSRALKALCGRYGVPVVRLNKRQFALTKSNYELLVSRMSERKAA
jgi:hypothetical protein